MIYFLAITNHFTITFKFQLVFSVLKLNGVALLKHAQCYLWWKMDESSLALWVYKSFTWSMTYFSSKKPQNNFDHSTFLFLFAPNSSHLSFNVVIQVGNIANVTDCTCASLVNLKTNHFLKTFLCKDLSWLSKV